MRLRHIILIAISVCLGAGRSAARDLTVAADGSSEYKTIQSAVDAVPTNNRERVVISIKNGTYPEQVRIHNSFLTLRGEDQKKTRIVASVDSGACPIAPGQSVEEHCSTLVAEGTDLVFEDFTAENPYKPDKGKGAALSVVGDSTRALLHNVDIVGYGGDTFVLSARRSQLGSGGDYYANHVYVSGTYHIIVPRGTAYVVNSKFWCLDGLPNCLFSEGVTRETDKLVIRDSVIDGAEPFGLGTYFRDTAWYFIDDTISSKVRPDGQIRRVPAKNYTMKWGEGRIYFAGNKAPDYPWLKDNIDQSPAKTAAAVTAAWTFPEWNPESTVGPVVREVKDGGGRIRVAFSESVTVRGTPCILLASGAKALYESGSGSDTLSFRLSHPGKVKKIELQGGAIIASAASLHERNANLALP
jgi:hypothetical protein